MDYIKGRYSKIEISLDEAKTEEELYLTGDYLNLVSISGNGSCEIKLDHRHSETINLREISEISGGFERVYFTTNGNGGKCTFYVGTGFSMHVSTDPQKLRNSVTVSAQAITDETVVGCLSYNPFDLNNVTILNTNGVYTCYVGPYNSDAAYFKAHAYILLPHRTLKFNFVDMYSLGAISYDGVNNVVLSIIGTYD